MNNKRESSLKGLLWLRIKYVSVYFLEMESN